MLPRISKVQGDDVDYLLFSSTDYISNTLFKTGKWEHHLQDCSLELIKGLDKPLILDIGANLGAYSVPMAKKIQSIGGRVIAFEAQRIVYYQLCANIILNRLDNFTAHHNALGHYLGEIAIPEIDYNNMGNIGAFSLDAEYRQRHDIETAMQQTTTQVPMITLDSLKLDQTPALVKIDVEGYELNVFKGGVNFLKLHNYPPILFEAWPHDWYQDSREELLSYVSSLGYQITKLGTNDGDHIIGDYLATYPK